MGQVADRADLDHARTALEGVQVAQQGFDFLAVMGLSLPAQQRRARAVENVGSFFEKISSNSGSMPKVCAVATGAVGEPLWRNARTLAINSLESLSA